MLTQLPRVPSLIPSSFATRAIGREVSITIFTASSLNSGEKLLFGRGNYFTFPEVHPNGWTVRKPRGTPIFADAVGWLRERDVLLPGVTTLARLVARERDAATGRLWESLYAATADQDRAALDALLVVPPGGRVSELERWRTGPARPSGPQMIKALHRVAEITGSGLSR